MVGKTVKFKGVDVQVNELTVDQLEEVLAPQEEAMSLIDKIFDVEMVTERMLIKATGIDQKELRSVFPSDLQIMVAAFKEANPVFLSGITALMASRGRN